MKTDCHRSEDVHAFVADEVSRPDNTAFREHLAECETCRNAVDDADRMIGRLRALPPVKASDGLVTTIRAAVREESRAHAWRPVAAIAAGLAILASVVPIRDRSHDEAVAIAPPSPKDAAAESVTRALDWFVRAQEDDGSWNGERWGGQQNYAAALTALPLLALVTDADDLTVYRDAALRGADFLVRHQNADGSFGRGIAYNHHIVTLALLRTYQRWPDAVPKSALGAAVTLLTASQGSAGTKQGNDPSVALWRGEAIDLASTLGFVSGSDLDDRASVGLARSSMPGNDKHLNFFTAYLTSVALQKENDTSGQKRLAELHREILRQQIVRGSEDGSWPPDDQWGRAGGRIYSTALASLTLRNG